MTELERSYLMLTADFPRRNRKNGKKQAKDLSAAQPGSRAWDACCRVPKKSVPAAGGNR